MKHKSGAVGYSEIQHQVTYAAVVMIQCSSNREPASDRVRTKNRHHRIVPRMRLLKGIEWVDSSSCRYSHFKRHSFRKNTQEKPNRNFRWTRARQDWLRKFFTGLCDCDRSSNKLMRIENVMHKEITRHLLVSILDRLVCIWHWWIPLGCCAQCTTKAGHGETSSYR